MNNKPTINRVNKFRGEGAGISKFQIIDLLRQPKTEVFIKEERAMSDGTTTIVITISNFKEQ